MYDFFISHHQSSGKKYAIYLNKRLREDFNRSVFFDDNNRELSVEINGLLAKAIEECRIFIAIITEGYEVSNWCMGELRHAREMKRSILICCKKGVKLPIAVGNPLIIEFEDEEQLVSNVIESIFGKLTAVIPAGGNATGLYPLNEGMPKVLLPLGKTPILFQIINSFDRDVISDIMILTNKHFHSMIEEYINLFGPGDMTIKCIPSPSPCLSNAIKSLGLSKTFCLHYSDIIIDEPINWKKILSDHQLRRKDDASIIGTLITTDVYRLPVGIVWPSKRQNEKDIIESFIEKPTEKFGFNINTAVAVLEAEYLDYVDDGDENLFEGAIKRAICANKKVRFDTLRGFHHIQTLSDWTRIQGERLDGT